MEVEEWRPVAEYLGLYEVSNQGRVRSLDRKVFCQDGVTRTFKGRELTPGVTKGGYHLVALRKDGETKSYNVHRLVAESFIPNPRALPLVRHLNDTGTDNRVANLAWGTYSENRCDAVASGAYVNQYARASHCISGHEFTESNTYRDRRGYRHCRTCRKHNNRERRKHR